MDQSPAYLRLGNAYHRHGDRPFAIKTGDRMHSLYLVGQTGTGKSTLLLNIALQDAKAGHGFCLIDPHGDLASSLSRQLGQKHIYWDIADPISPYGYNPLTRVSAPLRPLIASGLIDALKKQWSDAWGPRMEHLLRHAILALLEQDRADLSDIIRLYIDSDFRKGVVANVRDPQVNQFWTREYARMNYRTAFDGVAPIANKLGALLASPQFRRALCEPKEPLRFRALMDEGGILIINLAKGRLGTDNANVMGGLIVSSIMNAAFSRSTIPENERRPFFLAVDEFHNFTSQSFADMLPESRKYGLSLTLAHQHLLQLDPHVMEAIFGNIGSVLAFRMGAMDAPAFCRQLGDLEPQNLIRLPNHHLWVQLMIDGRKSSAFSAATFPLSKSAQR
ncbi:type IV secretion system DNA-binding domain-containing protein [Altererythrobacter luteolus]|uniref:Type IV secretion system DNA-binding domain-containing protein n=1 Tax=Pontixanthobacter luteolus TaxID=295089 RepID=A0A6I4V7F8_9SPHN|nr:type IV secretion system DNA-binding domain-containing protein [Pontixanthobacter luteolus]MXP48224.1 type IV secretion system DNA-binding domain-containing protein [Pontixanthobacter luteolus]